MTGKKRRRRKPSLRKDIIKPDESVIAKTTSEDVEDQEDFVRVYCPNSLHRLNSLPDYREVLGDGYINNLIAFYTSMGEARLIKESKDKNNTIMERIVMSQVTEALKYGKSKDAHAVAKYMTEQLQGKATTRMEITGKGGGAIQMNNGKQKDLDAMLDKLSDEEFEAYMKAIKVAKTLDARHGAK